MSQQAPVVIVGGELLGEPAYDPASEKPRMRVLSAPEPFGEQQG